MSETPALPDLDALQRLAEADIAASRAFMAYTGPSMDEEVRLARAWQATEKDLASALEATTTLAWIAATRALVAERDSAQDACLEWDTLHRKQRDRADAAEAHAAALVAEVARVTALLDKAAPHICPSCGPHARVDEEGCCAACGGDTHLDDALTGGSR